MGMFHYVITLDFALRVGGEIGQMYTVKDTRFTALGTIRSHLGESRESLTHRLLAAVQADAWARYRTDHSYDGWLPVEDSFGERTIIVFDLAPN